MIRLLIKSEGILIAKLLISTIVLGIAGTALSSGIGPDPVAMARDAELIVVGKVVKLNESSVFVRVEQTLKGKANSPDIEIFWERRENHEAPALKYAEGQDLLAFLNKKTSMYEPMGVNAIQLMQNKQLAADYTGAIRKLIAFHSAVNSEERNKIILSLLSSNYYFSQHRGFALIHREKNMRRLSPGALKSKVLQMANDSNPMVAANALSALSHVGDASSVPVLIQAMRSPHKHTSEAAYYSFKALTHSEVEIDMKQPPEKRETGIREAERQWKAARVK